MLRQQEDDHHEMNWWSIISRIQRGTELSSNLSTLILDNLREAIEDRRPHPAFSVILGSQSRWEARGASIAIELRAFMSGTATDAGRIYELSPEVVITTDDWTRKPASMNSTMHDMLFRRWRKSDGFPQGTDSAKSVDQRGASEDE